MQENDPIAPDAAADRLPVGGLTKGGAGFHWTLHAVCQVPEAKGKGTSQYQSSVFVASAWG